MPRAMPKLGTQFNRSISDALTLAEAGELARLNLPPGSIAAREWRTARLEALYETAYLRIFIQWEVFLEDAFLRMMCGYVSPLYNPTFLPGKQRSSTIADAQTRLFAGQDFLLWHNPGSVRKRAVAWFKTAPHEVVIDSNLSRLASFAEVRHRVAHGSAHARLQFDGATMGLAGRRYQASSAGRFLRDWDRSRTPAARWLQSIGSELGSLANQIAP